MGVGAAPSQNDIAQPMQPAQGFPLHFAQGQAAAVLGLQQGKLQGSQGDSLATRPR